MTPTGSTGPSTKYTEYSRYTKAVNTVCAEHQTYDSYWQHGSICEDYSRVCFILFSRNRFFIGLINSTGTCTVHFPWLKEVFSIE